MEICARRRQPHQVSPPAQRMMHSTSSTAQIPEHSSTRHDTHSTTPPPTARGKRKSPPKSAGSPWTYCPISSLLLSRVRVRASWWTWVDSIRTPGDRFNELLPRGRRRRSALSGYPQKARCPSSPQSRSQVDELEPLSRRAKWNQSELCMQLVSARTSSLSSSAFTDPSCGGKLDKRDVTVTSLEYIVVSILDSIPEPSQLALQPCRLDRSVSLRSNLYQLDGRLAESRAQVTLHSE